MKFQNTYNQYSYAVLKSNIQDGSKLCFIYLILYALLSFLVPQLISLCQSFDINSGFQMSQKKKNWAVWGLGIWLCTLISAHTISQGSFCILCHLSSMGYHLTSNQNCAFFFTWLVRWRIALSLNIAHSVRVSSLISRWERATDG